MLKNTSAFSHCPVLQHWNLRFSSCLFNTAPLLLVWTLTFLTLKILPAQEHLQTQKSTTGLLSTNTKNTQYWNLALNALQDFCLLLDGIKMWPAGLFYILLCVTFAFFVQLQWRLSRKRFIFHFIHISFFLKIWHWYLQDSVSVLVLKKFRGHQVWLKTPTELQAQHCLYSSFPWNSCFLSSTDTCELWVCLVFTVRHLPQRLWVTGMSCGLNTKSA